MTLPAQDRADDWMAGGVAENDREEGRSENYRAARLGTEHPIGCMCSRACIALRMEPEDWR